MNLDFQPIVKGIFHTFLMIFIAAKLSFKSTFLVFITAILIVVILVLTASEV